jgi:hypothetical protein
VASRVLLGGARSSDAKLRRPCNAQRSAPAAFVPRHRGLPACTWSRRRRGLRREWAPLGSNQRPLACEAGDDGRPGPRSLATLRHRRLNGANRIRANCDRCAADSALRPAYCPIELVATSTAHGWTTAIANCWFFARLSSARLRHAVRKGCSFAKKQESPPGLLVVVPRGRQTGYLRDAPQAGGSGSRSAPRATARCAFRRLGFGSVA